MKQTSSAIVKGLFIFTALLIIVQRAQAQIDLPIVIPPSPKAQVFDLFGNYTLTPNTGAPDISIPLYIIKSGKLEVPVTLRYHIGSVKPGYDHSDVGFGWVLDVGGQISRTIFGGPDDASPRLESQYFNSQLDQTIWTNVQQFGYCLLGQVDSEYDLFNYSFPGQNGEFIVDKDGTGAYQAHLLSYKPLKFQFTSISAPNAPSGLLMSAINITNANGDLYAFGGDGAVESCLGSTSLYSYTTWKLKNMTSADKADQINFTYTTAAPYSLSSTIPSKSITMDSGAEFWFRTAPSTGEYPAVTPEVTCGTSYQASVTYQETTIKEITFNSGKIVFDLTTDNQKINSLSIFDQQNNLIKKVVFYRASNSGNTYPQLDSLHIYNVSQSQNQSYKFVYNPNVITSDPTMGYKVDYWGYNNNGAAGCTNRSYDYVDCTNYAVQQAVHITASTSNREPNYYAAQYGILNKIIFPTKGETEFIYEGNSWIKYGLLFNKGGLRINSIIDRDGLGHEIKKTYQYEGGFVDHEPTSLPNYTTTTYQLVKLGLNYWVYRNRNFSNSISSDLGDNRVNYTKVTEISGVSSTDNIGKTIYYYRYDNPNSYTVHTSRLSGDDGKTVLYDHRDWDNGLLFRKDVLKLNSDYTFDPVSTERNYYSYDFGDTFYNLNISRLTVFPGSTLEGEYSSLNSMINGGGQQPPPALYKFFAVYDSKITTGRNHLVKTIRTDYFRNGGVLDSVINQSRHFYANAIHDQITRRTDKTSIGDSTITQYKYPHDFSTEQPYADMVNVAHRWAPVIEQTEYKASTSNPPLRSTRTNYYNWSTKNASQGRSFSTSSIMPISVETKVGSGSSEVRLQYLDYDESNNNIRSVSKAGASPVSYQWGYNHQYPVAQATGTAGKNIFYDSFEEGNGNSILNDCKTGHYSHTGTYSKNLSGLDDGSYTLTYWLKTGSIWSLQTSVVTVGSGIYTINIGANQIDDVRFCPSHAQLTTYTYDPLVGVTSSTDAKNEINYYEYDGFQRLMSIRDKDYNIVKYVDYHFNQ